MSKRGRPHRRRRPGPSRARPYSQAINAGGFVFVAGQLGVELGAERPVAGGIAPQTEQALQNLGAHPRGGRLVARRSIVKT